MIFGKRLQRCSFRCPQRQILCSITRSGGFLTAVLGKSAARKTPLLDPSAPTERGGYRYGRDEPCPSPRTLRQYSAKPSATLWAYSRKILLRSTPLDSRGPS